jgi:hypothetical protein
MGNERPVRGKTFQRGMTWFLPLACFLVFVVYQYAGAPLGDFSNYYFGAYFLAKGQLGSWLYDPALFNLAIAEAGFEGVFASYSPNPPAIALLFLPCTLLPPLAAKMVVNGLGSLLFLVFVYRWFTLFAIDKKWALAIPILFYRPIMANIYQGQLYFFLLILLVEGYLFLRREQSIFGCLCWGIAIFLKVFPLILGLYLLATRKFRAFGWLVAGVFTFYLISIGVSGSEVWKTFLTRILAKAQNGEVMENFALSFQSWNVGLRYLFVSDEMMNPNPLIPYEAGYWILLLLIKGLLLSVCVRFCIRNGPTYPSFAATVSCGLLLTPAGSVYSLVLWMVLLMSLVAGRSESYRLVFQLGLLGLICNVPFHTFSGLPLCFQFTRLFLMTLLWLSNVGRHNFSWAWYGSFLVLLLPLHYQGFLAPSQKDTSRYLLKGRPPAIVIGYQVENNHLVYHYWNEKGLEKGVADIEVTSADYQAVTIKDQVLYYRGMPLLRSLDEKKAPVLINRHTIIYLSNKNRGPGFYALRMIPVPPSPRKP